MGFLRYHGNQLASACMALLLLIDQHVIVSAVRAPIKPVRDSRMPQTDICAVPPMIAVYGGSFDPPHKGHSGLIETAARLKGVEKVIVVPSGGDVKPTAADAGTESLAIYEKPGRANFDKRLMWTKALWDSLGKDVRDKVIVSEVERTGGIETPMLLDTLEKQGWENRTREGPCGQPHLSFIVGSDYAGSIHAWSKAANWMQRHLIVNLRDQDEEQSTRSVMEKFGWPSQNLHFVRAPFQSVSSTEVRKRIFIITHLKKHRTWVNVRLRRILERITDLAMRELQEMLPERVFISLSESMEQLSAAYLLKYPNDGQVFDYYVKANAFQVSERELYSLLKEEVLGKKCCWQRGPPRALGNSLLRTSTRRHEGTVREVLPTMVEVRRANVRG